MMCIAMRHWEGTFGPLSSVGGKRLSACPRGSWLVVAAMAPTLHIQSNMNGSIFSRNSTLATAAFFGALILCFAGSTASGQRPVPMKPQIPSPKTKITLPPGFAPPNGMCRIWIDDVPADQQPAPTDCATAVKNRPANGRVIFSEKKIKTTPPPKPKPKHEEEQSL